MSGNGSRPQVLVIGLDPYRVPGPWDPKPVATAIDDAVAKLSTHGVEAEACLVGLDGGDAVEDRVAEALNSRPWDCVVVGGGIRKSEELVELFESIVNLIHHHAPQADIAFNRAPDSLVDAIGRRIHIT